ncbi:MAG: phosphatidate cytidylyltransferase [Armatimonadota bacterium]
MLRHRLLAAVFGIPMLFVLLGLNWLLRSKGSTDDLPLLLIVTIIAAASGWEVSRVVRGRYEHTSLWNGLYAALILPFMVHAIRLTFANGVTVGAGNLATLAKMPVGSMGLLIDSLGATAAVMLLFLGVWSDIEQRGRVGLIENLYVILGGLYLGTATSTLLLLGGTPMHEAAVAFVFIGVFVLDTAAYFGGKFIGGPKLAPAISPNKTITGSVCGLLATILIALLLLALPGWHGGTAALWANLGSVMGVGQLIWLGFALGVFGQIGDLVESAFKRWGRVKDSGSVIPGHGGFLDRFDSLFLAAPICYLLVQHYLHLPIGW